MQKPSLLVDVCRQTIIFSDVGSITKCMKMIGDDPDVQVVRLKNRMDPSYDGRQSLGYRNISINLKLVTAQTKTLGLDTHICELQLLLDAMAEIKVCCDHYIHASALKRFLAVLFHLFLEIWSAY